MLPYCNHLHPLKPKVVELHPLIENLKAKFPDALIERCQRPDAPARKNAAVAGLLGHVLVQPLPLQGFLGLLASQDADAVPRPQRLPRLEKAPGGRARATRGKKITLGNMIRIWGTTMMERRLKSPRLHKLKKLLAVKKAA